MSTPVRETPQLCKVALLVGKDTMIDYALPAGVALIAVIEDLIPRIDEILRKRGLPALDDAVTYQLCRADATPLDLQRCLDDLHVYDGDRLWLLPTEATERYPEVIEEVSTAVARYGADHFKRVDPGTARRVVGGLCVALVAYGELLLTALWWQRHGWTPAIVSWGLTLLLLWSARTAARARDAQRRGAASVFAWAALVAAVPAAAMSVPGSPGGWHVVAASCVALAGVAALASVTGRYTTMLAASMVIGLSIIAVAAIRASDWQVTTARLAVAFLSADLVLVTYAASLAVMSSGVPGPWFPSVTNRGMFGTAAGAPANSVSPVESSTIPTPEQIAAWARRGNQTITGLLIGAATVLAVAAPCAVTPHTGGGWRYLAFTLAICAIIVLRSRAFVDRWCSVALAIGATAALAAVVGRYAEPTSVATTLWCVAAVLGLIAVGLFVAFVVPKARINAPIRRAVEVSEYVLILPVFFWAFWLLGLLGLLRNLAHGVG